ncbi:hypothetical protein WMF31_03200 [Sorangium sp. So ce1036]|uniref:hypothetical protein n=1 Tax=Sorangium sp. So ce1036 TaxID=3133328 RepID=UPI003F090C89
MSEQNRDAAERTAAQAGAGEDAAQGRAPEEIGHGPGLDPPSAPPDEDESPADEAYADRPATAPVDARRPTARPQDDDADVAAIQRPPADS